MEGSSFLHPAKAVEAAGMSEGMRVADFGAGSGFFTRAAARMVGPHAQVWAVDVDTGLLNRIKNLSTAEGLRNVEIIRGNVEELNGSGLPENSFDFVMVTNLLFSVADKVAVVAEAKRILKRNGKVLVVDWQDSFGGLGPHPDHVVTAAQAQQLFESQGFIHTTNLRVGAYHWGFVVRKKAE